MRETRETVSIPDRASPHPAQTIVLLAPGQIIFFRFLIAQAFTLNQTIVLLAPGRIIFLPAQPPAFFASARHLLRSFSALAYGSAQEK